MAPSLYYLAHGRRCAASTSGSTGNSSASLLPRSSPSLGSSAEERTVAELAALVPKARLGRRPRGPARRRRRHRRRATRDVHDHLGRRARDHDRGGALSPLFARVSPAGVVSRARATPPTPSHPSPWPTPSLADVPGLGRTRRDRPRDHPVSLAIVSYFWGGSTVVRAVGGGSLPASCY